jgi:SNF2 family DNA or RNA helicase
MVPTTLHARRRIPKKERVLLFIQYRDLMIKVAEALKANKVTYIEIQGTATQKSKNLERFQDPEADEKVLLLGVEDESASGA